MNLRDSVIIVTGSATGLGASVVKQVAAKGARVVINYTKSAKEAWETEAVCDYLGVECIVCQADVSVVEDCDRLATETLKKWGRHDGLVIDNEPGVCNDFPIVGLPVGVAFRDRVQCSG